MCEEENEGVRAAGGDGWMNASALIGEEAIEQSWGSVFEEENEGARVA